MKFSYTCDEGHTFANEHAPGRAPSVTVCDACRAADAPVFYAARDYAADFASLSISTGDPFRAFDLSTRKERAAAEQGRAIGGPRDHFERKVLERERGIVYVGDDTSGFTDAAKRGIAREKARTKE